MRHARAILFLLWVGLAAPVWGGTHLGMQSGATGGFSTATASFTGVAVGDQFACGVGWANGAATITSVSNGTDTFATPSDVADASNTGGRYLLSSSVSGSVTITLTMSTNTDASLICHRFSGAGAYDVGQGVTSNPANASGTDGISTGSHTLTGSNGYLFAWVQQQCCAPSTITAGTGYTDGLDEVSGGALQVHSEYATNKSGATTATFTTSSTSLNYLTGYMAFKAASGGAAVNVYRKRVYP